MKQNVKVCLLYSRGKYEHVRGIEQMLVYLGSHLPGYTFVTLPGIIQGMEHDPRKRDASSDLQSCDLVLAILDQPSTDIGLAIGMALYHIRKPTLLVSNTTAVVEERLFRMMQSEEYRALVLYRILVSRNDLVSVLPEAVAHFKIGEPGPEQFTLGGLDGPDAAFAPVSSTPMGAGYSAAIQPKS
ncbi:MAG TPA: hypothetical protein VGE35_02935 [Candidatus Paceibacterota bacterium]